VGVQSGLQATDHLSVLGESLLLAQVAASTQQLRFELVSLP
jgi:hypothetical protein